MKTQAIKSASNYQEQSWFQVIPEPIVSVSGTKIEANAMFWSWSLVKKIPQIWSLKNWIPSQSAIEKFENTKPFSLKMVDQDGTYEDVLIEVQSGMPRVVEIRVMAFDNSRYLFFRDLTDKRRLEKEVVDRLSDLSKAYLELEKKNHEIQSIQESLVQAGKLAALGELAAGIAHELNQPLLGIKGYSQELKSILTDPNEPDKIPVFTEITFGQVTWSLKEIISNVDRMASIISQMRAYVRKSTENYEWVDLKEVVSEASKLLQGQLKSHGIMILDKSLSHKIWANRVQLEQVLINLLSNAKDAILESKKVDGKIEIKTKTLGKQIEITVSDNGIGMDARTKSKAFNPFFTTKEVGKGTGLGLSLSHGIITKFNGSMRIESEPGVGSEFIIILPEDFRET